MNGTEQGLAGTFAVTHIHGAAYSSTWRPTPSSPYLAYTCIPPFPPAFTLSRSPEDCPCSCTYGIDPGCKCQNLEEPVKISVSKTPVYASYPLTYFKSIYWKPEEKYRIPSSRKCYVRTCITTVPMLREYFVSCMPDLCTHVRAFFYLFKEYNIRFVYNTIRIYVRKLHKVKHTYMRTRN